MKLSTAYAQCEPEQHRLIADSFIFLALLSPEKMIDPSLQEDLAFALQHKKIVVVMHEGGLASSDFSEISELCPSDLVKLGLFSDLALEWHHDLDNREVSVQLIWHKINALCRGREHTTLETNAIPSKHGKDFSSTFSVRNATPNETRSPKDGQEKHTKNQVVPQGGQHRQELQVGAPSVPAHGRKNPTDDPEADLVAEALAELEHA